ncbi:MAG: YfjI family protein [Paracoccaceae bacterium]
MTAFAEMDKLDPTYLQGIGANGPLSAPVGDEEPTPLIHEIPDGDPFPIEAMGPLKDAAMAILDKTQAPSAIGAQSLLAAASLACQGHADVQTLGGIRPISLYALTIAKSGERKSSCDTLAMEAVRLFEREMADVSSDEQNTFRNESDIWEATHTALIRDAAKGDKGKSTSAKADLEALGAAPEQPLLPFLTATDPTFEGLTRNLDRSRPSIGIFSDEAGQFLGGHAMNSDNRTKTMAGLSKFWDGDPINRTRAGDGAMTFHGRRLCTHLMVQPVIAHKLLGDPTARDQGFLARFLMCNPPSTIGTRLLETHSPSSDDALLAYGARIGELLRRDMPLREGARNELELPILRMSDAAEKVLRAFANALERKQAPGEELCESTAFASKSAEQAIRIAGVLAVYAGETNINLETISNAITLADWYLAEAVRLRDGAAIAEDVAKADKLRQWLLERWSEDFIAITPIVQAGAANIKSAKEARHLVPHLVANGWLIQIKGGANVKGTHRKEAWRIVGRKY